MSMARRRPRAAAVVALFAMVLRLLLPLLHEHRHERSHEAARGSACEDGLTAAIGAGHVDENLVATQGDAAFADHHACSACDFVGQAPSAPPIALELPCFLPWASAAIGVSIAIAERWSTCARPPSRAPPSLVI
jgi:hypothetical protein